MCRKSLIIASALVLGITFTVSLPDARGVQCKVKWSFGIACNDVYVAVVNQIKAWQITRTCHSTTEHCSYELLSATPDLIKAKHLSSTSKEVESLQFLLVPLEEEIACKMTGDSTAQALGDPPVENSTIFCGLQNLVEGSGLTKVVGYKQFSNKWICTGYETVNCSIV